MLRLVPIRQRLTAGTIEDIPAHLRRELQALSLWERIHPGMRVAIGVGSRGISSIRPIVKTLVSELLALGADPFLVPAMGSHGASTAEGQRDVLVGYGLDPATLGIPIHSTMQTVQIGQTPDGMPVHFDAIAAAADAIFLVNRIKPHTAFRNHWESGLFKMLSVGFGKPQGAAEIHRWGVHDAMPAAARIVLDALPVVAGIAIVENGHHQPAQITALPAERIEIDEPVLLKLAWQHLPRLPLEPLDLLIIREIGKDISGTGMDLNVVGMWRRSGGPVQPNFRVIVALDLTAQSYGNAIGVGYADLITRRLYDKIDFQALAANCLTAHNFNGGKIPITLPTDQDVIEAALPAHNRDRARVALIRNTLDLGSFWISEGLLAEVASFPDLAQAGPPIPLAFDEDGDLHSIFSGTPSNAAPTGD